MSKYREIKKAEPRGTVQLAYPCTECKGDAFLGHTASKDADWGGRIKPGERLCLVCARKRGVRFF